MGVGKNSSGNMSSNGRIPIKVDELKHRANDAQGQDRIQN
jgi:hypothetical protein